MISNIVICNNLCCRNNSNRECNKTFIVLDKMGQCISCVQRNLNLSSPRARLGDSDSETVLGRKS